MDELWRLVLLSLAMFVGCYLAGSIPLALALSEGLLRKVTTFGAGLLIGTALIIIIPEGVESLFGEALHSHAGHTLELNTPRLIPEEEAPFPVAGGEGMEEAQAVVADQTAASLITAAGEGYYEEQQLQLFMGASLTLGFIFMLLVDQLGGGGHSHSTATESGGGGGGGGGGGRHDRKLTATIGLVVHAAADGLALGAAAGLSKVDVELIIFLAIMLHKAPAAFGFTSFLIHEGYDRYTAKRHLLVFALAAPVAAFVSYFGLVRVMYVVQLPITGITMLFSAGTFLYVATVHVLTELTHHSHSTDPSTNGPTSNSKLSKTELLLVIIGALLPLAFNVVHSH